MSCETSGLSASSSTQLHRIDQPYRWPISSASLRGSEQGKIHHIFRAARGHREQLTKAREITEIAAVENLYNVA